MSCYTYQFILLLSPVVMSVSYASTGGWNYKQGQADPNSEYHKRLPLEYKDDITSDQNVETIKLTKGQLHQAQVWGLSSEEEKRYVALMQDKSGFFYGSGAHMSPTEVLGANARSDEERNKYAKKDAQDQFQYLAKYFSYNASYSKAAAAYKEKLNLPVLRPFNTAKFSPYNYQPIDVKGGDKYMLFVGIHDSVRPVVSYFMGVIEKDDTVQLNVYFIENNNTKGSVLDWARSQNIPTEMVIKHDITLNYDNGMFSTLAHKEKPPILVRVRSGKSDIIDMGRF